MGPGLLLLLLLRGWGKGPGPGLGEQEESMRVDGEPPVSISWQRDGLALGNDSGATLMPDGSLHLAALLSHRGLPSRGHEYHCVAQNRYGRLVSRRARVQLASLSRFHQHPESVQVERGGVARFQCLIRGVPEPSISWERNGTALNTADHDHRVTLLPGGILHITSVSPADVGIYRCVARNVAGTRPQLTLSDGRSIGVEGIQVLGTGNLMIADVSVQHSGVYVCAANRPGTRVRRTAQGVLLVQAPPEFVQWPQSLSKSLGSSATFTCVAQGVPEPRLVWLKNGKVLNPGENVRLTHNNSTLTLAVVSVEDEAIYHSLHLCLTWEPPPSGGDIIGYVLHLRPVGEPAGPELQEAVSKGTSEHVFSDLEPATAYTIHLRAYSAEGASQDSAPILASTMGTAPAALSFSTTVVNATSVQASWELPPQPGPIQGFKLFHRKLPAAHFEGPLLLASSVSSFLYTDLEPAALYEIKLQAFNGNGDGNSSARLVSLRDVPLATPGSEAGCSCSHGVSSSLPGVVVGIHVGLAALVICLLCLFLGWRHRANQPRL
ncbi:Immunoglobulin superfamily DCC subclass member 3 [Tupaia chinensis]|nr:Immunoglobulin superfamily DCC subclass member 3 [Tupaia chinensis]